MNADHYTEIGSTHLVCQDYALSGLLNDGDTAYAIVSDGCSSSPHSEIGAQILCHTAKYFIDLCGYYVVLSGAFGKMIIKRAGEIIRFYNLPKSSLDATLIVTATNGIHTLIRAWGDGYIGIRKNGFESIKISYTKEAPCYLSYLSDKKLFDSYLNTFPENMRTVVYCRDEKEPKGITTTIDSKIGGIGSTDYQLEFFEATSIIISSDGINSYLKGQEKIDVSEDFSGYKRTTGQFVKSNMMFHKKKMQREGIQHYDDISVAVIDCGKQ